MPRATRLRVDSKSRTQCACDEKRPPERGRPIVKWAGGKTRLLYEILRRKPARFTRYIEPFVGGGAVFFRIDPPDAILSDSNVDLIDMYRCVARDPNAIIRRLQNHATRHSEQHFYKTRTRWNERTGRQADLDRAAMFIYLNKTCYNGLWRVNRKGDFNVPMGRYVNPKIVNPSALRAASRQLQRAQLHAHDYRTVLADAGPGDFIYFDPPYQPTSVTANFTSYTADAFDATDQRTLASTVRELANAGCAVMLSNSDTPFVRELYTGFTLDSVHCARAINSHAARRGAVHELLVTVNCE